MTGAEPCDWRPGTSRDVLRCRADLLARLRAFLTARGFVEVDTPLVTTDRVPERDQRLFEFEGGALIASPEAGLKRLLATGMDAVFQLGHVFRAGEAGRWHNPEFCMLEWYRAGNNMGDAIAETDALLQHVARTPALSLIRFVDVFRQRVGIDPFSANVAALQAAAVDLDVAPRTGTLGADRAAWLDLLMGFCVVPDLGRAAPVAVTHFPSGDTALAAPDADDSRCAARFEIYWRGVELANGARELTDAALAERRLYRMGPGSGQAEATGASRLMAAIRSGLPPCAGVALGVDRLLALTLGKDNVSEVMAFDWHRR